MLRQRHGCTHGMAAETAESIFLHRDKSSASLPTRVPFAAVRVLRRDDNVPMGRSGPHCEHATNLGGAPQRWGANEQDPIRANAGHNVPSAGSEHNQIRAKVGYGNILASAPRMGESYGRYHCE